MDLLAFEITFVAEEQLSLKMGLRPFFCLSLDWLDAVLEVDKGLCYYLEKTMQCFTELERLNSEVLALYNVYLNANTSLNSS